MSKPEFTHLNLSSVGDVVLVEIVTTNIQGPALAQELGTELSHVIAQDWAKRLLLDFRKVDYLSSTGFAVLFRVVTQAKAKGQQIKLCSMDPAVELGAGIVGLNKLVEIHQTQESALKAFSKP
jgi:anti-anti-sigma factor